MSRKLYALTAGAVTAAVSLLTATSAVAAPSSTTSVVPTTYNNACGSGYTVIDTLTAVGGHVYLTYNSSNGYNCVVTVRNSPGTAILMSAWIERTGEPTSNIIDQGNYTTYAGPVYLYAAGKCIDWGGEIGNYFPSQFNSHCG